MKEREREKKVCVCERANNVSGTETKDGARMIGKNFHGTNPTY